MREILKHETTEMRPDREMPARPRGGDTFWARALFLFLPPLAAVLPLLYMCVCPVYNGVIPLPSYGFYGGVLWGARPVLFASACARDGVMSEAFLLPQCQRVSFYRVIVVMYIPLRACVLRVLLPGGPMSMPRSLEREFVYVPPDSRFMRIVCGAQL